MGTFVLELHDSQDGFTLSQYEKDYPLIKTELFSSTSKALVADKFLEVYDKIDQKFFHVTKKEVSFGYMKAEFVPLQELGFLFSK